jgi:cobalamin biosynthesis Co2+ chelatase CbiK
MAKSPPVVTRNFCLLAINHSLLTCLDKTLFTAFPSSLISKPLKDNDVLKINLMG